MNTQNVRDLLEGISSVKMRAKAALDANDRPLFNELMGDLWALEACLVGEATKLVSAIDKAAA